MRVMWGGEMNAKLTVELSEPKDGWIQLKLGSGEQELAVPVSYTPFDFLEEFGSAVAGYLEAHRPGVARLNCEPEEYDVFFEAAPRPSELRVKAVLYPKGRREKSVSEVVLLHEGDAKEIGRTIWRALRKLESQFDPQHWSHGYPTKIVEILGALTAVAR